MREKIDGIMNNGIAGWRTEHELIKRDVLNQILSYQIEEIKKVENPFDQDYQSSSGDFYDAVEDFRQKIIKKLGEK